MKKGELSDIIAEAKKKEEENGKFVDAKPLLLMELEDDSFHIGTVGYFDPEKGDISLDKMDFRESGIPRSMEDAEYTRTRIYGSTGEKNHQNIRSMKILSYQDIANLLLIFMGQTDYLTHQVSNTYHFLRSALYLKSV
ncbi:MAG: hypothetical protein NTZ97_04705 [Candidatus Moranbacteria bacterium]|nr:hypothetical protein [Candidatus Moranbacteria bacterium]